jgi:hypothetical protein
MEGARKTKKVRVAQAGARMAEIGKTILYGYLGLNGKKSFQDYESAIRRAICSLVSKPP